MLGKTFYVATCGDDRWSGQLPEPSPDGTDGPFSTLARARNAVRAFKAGGSLPAPITVLVRGGKYCLEQTLVLGPEDGGSADCPVTYQAYPGEAPVLSGGRVIEGWQPYRDGIYQAELPGARGGKWKSRQLFYDGARQVRARWPNRDPDNPLYGGWSFMEGPADDGDIPAWRFPEGWSWAGDASSEGKQAHAFHYKPGTFLRRWAKPSEGEVVVYLGSNWWNNYLPIQAVDEARRIITTTRDAWQMDRAPWHCAVSFRANNRFIVENLLEELDQPGEWCLDSEDGRLYFWPPDQRFEGSVIVPRLRCLLALRGVSWVTLRGFTLTETLDGDDDLREDADGYGAYYPHQGWSYCGEAIHLKRAEHCTIADNHICGVGGNGIYLEGYNFRNVIHGNEVGDAGANGICLIGSMQQHPLCNEVTDNEIHHCGVFQSWVAGVRLGLSDANRIAHNAIHHVPHHAINLGSNGYGRNIVEYNEIRYSAMQCRDTGAINCWGDVPGWGPQRDAERSGHIIRYNLVADTVGCRVDHDLGRIIAPDPQQTFGIYLDDFTSNCLVYGNIVVRSGVGINVHAGKNNFMENNVLVDCHFPVRYWDSASPRFACRQMAGFMTGNHFCRNIIYFTTQGQYLFNLGNAWTERVIQQSDENIFWNGPVGSYVILDPTGDAEHDLAAWRKMGYDRSSQVVDPQFVDPVQGDFRLRSDSPAPALGFQPIPVHLIGVRRRRGEPPGR